MSVRRDAQDLLINKNSKNSKNLNHSKNLDHSNIFGDKITLQADKAYFLSKSGYDSNVISKAVGFKKVLNNYMDLMTIALFPNLALGLDPKAPAAQEVFITEATDTAADITSDTDISTTDTDAVTHQTTSPLKGISKVNVGEVNVREAFNLANDILVEEGIELEDLPELDLNEAYIRESHNLVNDILVEEGIELESLPETDLSEVDKIEYLSLINTLINNEKQTLLNNNIQPPSHDNLINKLNNSAHFTVKEQAMTAALKQYKQIDRSKPVPTLYNIEVYDKGQVIESVVFTFQEVKNIHDKLKNLSEIRRSKADQDKIKYLKLVHDIIDRQEQMLLTNKDLSLSHSLINRIKETANFNAKIQAMDRAREQYKQTGDSSPVPTSYNTEVYDNGQMIGSMVFTFEEVQGIDDRLMCLSEIDEIRRLKNNDFTIMWDYEALRNDIIREYRLSEIKDTTEYNTSDDSMEENSEPDISHDDYMKAMQQLLSMPEATQGTTENHCLEIETAYESDEADDAYEAAKKEYEKLLNKNMSTIQGATKGNNLVIKNNSNIIDVLTEENTELEVSDNDYINDSFTKIMQQLLSIPEATQGTTENHCLEIETAYESDEVDAEYEAAKKEYKKLLSGQVKTQAAAKDHRSEIENNLKQYDIIDIPTEKNTELEVSDNLFARIAQQISAAYDGMQGSEIDADISIMGVSYDLEMNI